MRARDGLGFLAAAVLGGGCLQVLGYEEPTLVETGSGGGNTAHCSDAKKDDDETGLDCGGSCSPCADGDGCKVGPDCQSHVCGGGACLVPECEDKAKNGDETDADCGGMTCPQCATGKACEGALDCMSGSCSGGVCQASCSDEAKNSEETGTDCGGPCAPCKNGDGCATGVDCESGVCQGVNCVDSFVWAHGFGGADTNLSSASEGSAVGLDAADNIVLVGALGDTADFGGGLLKSAGQQDVLVAKFGTTGNHLWSKRFGDSSQQLARSVAVAPSGDIVVAGFFGGSIDFGLGAHTSAGGTGDGFITKLNASGNEQWTLPVGGPGFDACNSVAMTSEGAIFATGFFIGSMTINGTMLTGAGSTDIFLTKLSPGGPPLWTMTFGDSNAQIGQSVAADSMGNVILAATSMGPLSFGGANLPNLGGNDFYVAKLDTNGSHLWSKRFGDADEQDVIKLATDSMGSVVIAGAFKGSIDFGGGALVSKGAHDLFVAKLDAKGNHLWSKSFGDVADQTNASIAVDAIDNITVMSTCAGTVDFGGGALTSAAPPDATDVFVAKLDASGKHLWSRRYGNAQNQAGNAVTTGKMGEIILTGGFDGLLDFGGKPPLMNSGAKDAFLAKLLTP